MLNKLPPPEILMPFCKAFTDYWFRLSPTCLPPTQYYCHAKYLLMLPWSLFALNALDIIPTF